MTRFRVPRLLIEIMKRKIGMAGLLIVIVNVLLAIFAPLIAPHDPLQGQVAEDYAMPAWVALYPGTETSPRNLVHEIKSSSWKVSVDPSLSQAVRVNTGDGFLSVVYSAQDNLRKVDGPITFTYHFTYAYADPRSFLIRIPYNITITGRGIQYRISLSLADIDSSRIFNLFDSYPPWRASSTSRWGENAFKLSSRDIQVVLRSGVGVIENLARSIFPKPGNYRMEVKVVVRQAEDFSEPVALSLDIGTSSIRIPGTVYGVFGTNRFGEDVFSQFVYGSRVSLAVGLLSTAIVVALGLFLGVFAGYKGGRPDRIFVFIADTIQQIPLLPIILLILLFVSRGIFLIIVIISALGWAGLARQFRSWTMSLKERPFVEAARAAGASEWYLMYRVIAPQTVPILAVALSLGVPTGIFTEAGVSILGFGDPSVVSWGKMINEALFQGGVARGAWWWVSPPIVGIFLLALGFAFIGFTLDEVLNPRLRRTR